MNNAELDYIVYAKSARSRAEDALNSKKRADLESAIKAYRNIRAEIRSLPSADMYLKTTHCDPATGYATISEDGETLLKSIIDALNAFLANCEKNKATPEKFAEQPSTTTQEERPYDANQTEPENDSPSINTILSSIKNSRRLAVIIAVLFLVILFYGVNFLSNLKGAKEFIEDLSEKQNVSGTIAPQDSLISSSSINNQDPSHPKELVSEAELILNDANKINPRDFNTTGRLQAIIIDYNNFASKIQETPVAQYTSEDSDSFESIGATGVAKLQTIKRNLLFYINESSTEDMAKELLEEANAIKPRDFHTLGLLISLIDGYNKLAFPMNQAPVETYKDNDRGPFNSIASPGQKKLDLIQRHLKLFLKIK